MAVLALARAKSLRDERVQSHEQTATKEREHDKDIGTQADGAHGGRAVGEPPNHHRVHDGHAHPAKFGQHERNGKLQGGAEFGAKCLKSKHVRRVGAKSLRGTEKRSNQEGMKPGWRRPDYSIRYCTRPRWRLRSGNGEGRSDSFNLRSSTGYYDPRPSGRNARRVNPWEPLVFHCVPADSSTFPLPMNGSK